MIDTPLSKLNELVAAAQSAMDQVDQWDEGHTYTGGPFSQRREVSLEIVALEHDVALLELVSHVLEHERELAEVLTERLER